MKFHGMRALLLTVVWGFGTGCMATQVQPPKTLPPNIPLTSEQIAKLPMREQPPALKQALTDLAQGSLQERKAKLKRHILSHLVFVKGGTFQMGDFGPIWLTGQLPLTEHKDDKVLHKVTLSSYSIEAYKTTYAEFDVYSDATRTTRAGMNRANVEGAYRNPYVPVGVYWPQANAYCQWLGKLTGMPFALPTEAQWEYAARSRGQFFAYSTDNGEIDIGRNIAGPGYGKKLAPSSPDDSMFLDPIGLFPPSPLGLYDMGTNGWEWTHDYYNADYYAHSDVNNPTGPKTGDKRVTRGWDPGSNFWGGITMLRKGDDPMLKDDLLTGKMEPSFSADHGVRCVVDTVTPIAH